MGRSTRFSGGCSLKILSKFEVWLICCASDWLPSFVRFTPEMFNQSLFVHEVPPEMQHNKHSELESLCSMQNRTILGLLFPFHFGRLFLETTHSPLSFLREIWETVSQRKKAPPPPIAGQVTSQDVTPLPPPNKYVTPLPEEMSPPSDLSTTTAAAKYLTFQAKCPALLAHGRYIYLRPSSEETCSGTRGGVRSTRHPAFRLVFISFLVAPCCSQGATLQVSLR